MLLTLLLYIISLTLEDKWDRHVPDAHAAWLCKWQASPDSEVHPFYWCLYKFGKLGCYPANRENLSIIYYSQLFTIWPQGWRHLQFNHRVGEIIQWLKMLVTQTWSPQFNPWNHGARRELTLKSCTFTWKYRPWHVCILPTCLHAYICKYILITYYNFLI